MSVGTERVIEGDAVYEKQEFLLRANLKQAGWRTARQNVLEMGPLLRRITQVRKETDAVSNLPKANMNHGRLVRDVFHG
jgi:hypothetical protein